MSALKKGQKVTLEHKAKEFTVIDVANDVVKIQFIDGHPYEIHSDSAVYDCNFRGKGVRQLLKQSNDKRGYKMVAIRANGQSCMMKVHRLVAMCFLPNPDNLPQVNHKDEVHSNNDVSNLEWCDQEYNVRYSIQRTINGCGKRPLSRSAKLTKAKVRSMMVDDIIVVNCNTAAELESVYQTALQVRREDGVDIQISKSGVTMTVTLRRFS